MTEKRFSKGEAIAFGWKTMNDNLGFFIVLMLIVFAITGIPSIVSNLTKESMPSFSGLMTFISQLLGIFIAPGMIKIYLNVHDGQPARYEDIFAYSYLFLRYLGASLLVTLVVVSALILSLLPIFLVKYLHLPDFWVVVILFVIMLAAIIFTIRLQFFGYFIVDQDAGAIESIKKSYVLTEGLMGQLIIFIFLIILINVAGALCLLIGLFATIPATTLAVTYVYRKLTAESQVVAAPVQLSE